MFLLLLSVVYVNKAMLRAVVVNTDMKNTDQDAYLTESMQLWENSYKNIFTLNYNRMPAYWVILTTVYRPKIQDFFNSGKLLNIGLSYACLMVLYFIFKRYLPLSSVINLVLIVAFTDFIYKASYVQAEILFCTLFFISFLLLTLLLDKPTYSLAILVGATVGVTHLTKAAVFPLVVIFIFLFFIKLLGKPKRIVLSSLAMLAVFLSATLIVLGPYFLATKQKVGRYVYNVNSSVFAWADSWQNILDRPDAGRAQTEYVPSERLPGPVKYFQTHTISQMFSRISNGAQLYKDTVFRAHSPLLYGYDLYVIGFFLFLCVSMVVNYFRLKVFILKNYFKILFLCIALLVYSILICWYAPIAYGNRFSLIMFIPLMFSLYVALWRLNFYSAVQLRLLKYFDVLLLIFILLDIFIHVSPIVMYIDGGP